MPCGGIYPIEPGCMGPCWYCNKKEPPADHALIEWDSALHEDCVRPFLDTTEGELVLRHGHHVQVGSVILQKEMEGAHVDPDACLQELRNAITEACLGKDDVDLELLAAKFEALDDWLKRGGFLPKDWQR